MNEKATFNESSPDQNFILQSKKMDLDAGWLGRLFGSKANAPFHIAGVFVILLIISGISVLFFNTTIQAIDYWKIITPLITMAMGYIFGKSQ